MSYSRVASSVTRVQQILDALLLVDGAREWPARDAHKLAYQLREAFAAAAKLPEFSRYAVLRERFILHSRNGVVSAEPRVATAYEAVKFSLGKVSLESVNTVEGAVGAAVKHNAEELHLPNFPNDEEQLAALFRWTEQAELFIISHYGAGITLTRKNPGEMKWMPS